MATADDLKRQQELNKALEEENAILRKRNKLQSDGYDMSSALVESLKEVLGIRSRQNTFEQDILNTNKEINKSILGQKSGLQDLQSTKIQIRKNNDLISKASTLQLGLEKSIGEQGIKHSQNYVERLSYQKQLEDAIEEQNKNLQKGDLVAEQQLQMSKDYLAIVEDQNTKQFANLTNLQKQYSISVLNTKELQKQTQERKKDKEMLLRLQASMGIAGALVKTLATIPGLGDAAAKAFEDVERKLKADAEESGKVSSRWKTFGMILSETGKHLTKALTDPAVILTSIFDTYLDINKASVELSHLTGQNAVKFENIGINAASLKDSLETMSELTKETGRNAQNIFSSEVIGQAAAMKTTIGLAAQEVGQLAIMSQTSGKSVDDITDSIVATTSAFNKTNRSAVSQGQVLRDVANTSESIKLSLGNNDIAIAKAASAARRLGLDLAKVDQIAGSITNFEDSIGKELEAELLTGKQLNLEKARELALSNDLEGLSKELFKNSSDINEFGKMNRIQQESYAAALGMTRDEMARMAYLKALDGKMTEEQAAKAAGVNAKEMRRVAIQENFAKALEKIAGAVAPILDLLGDILSIPLVPYLLMGAFAVTKIGGGLMNTVKSMGSLAGGAMKFVQNLNMKGVMDFFGGLKDKFGALKDAFKEGLLGKVAGKAEGAAGGLADKAKDKLSGKAEGAADGLVNKGLDKVAGDKAEEAGDKVAGTVDKTKNVKAGTGVKDFLTNLGKGLEALAKSFKAMGPTGFIYLAAGLVLVTGAVIGIGYALNLAAPAIEAFGKVITAVFGGIATLITAVADGFVRIMQAVSMENIMPMLLLGPALFGIAAGLAAIALAGPMAIPALLSLTALGAVAGGITSIFGGGEEKIGAKKEGEGSSSIAAVNEKLTTLINLVRDGQDIYLDSNKIGRAQSLAISKQP